MLSPLSEDDSFAISWISLSDLLMIAAVLFAGTSMTLERSQRQLEAKLETEKRNSAHTALRLEKLQRELDAAIESNEKLSATLTSIRKQLADAEHRLSSWQLDRSKLQSELQRLQNMEKDSSTAALRAAKLHEELLRANEAMKVLAEELAEAKRIIEKLEVERRELAAEVSESNADLQSARRQLSDFAKQVDKLQAELSELQKLYSAAMRELTDVKRRADSHEISERTFGQTLLGIRSRNNLLRRVIFVVDRSGSMTRSSNNSDGSRWDYVCDEIERWLTLLPLGEAQLILFNHEVDVYPAAGKFVTISSRVSGENAGAKLLVDVLRNTTPDDGTNTAEALRQAYLASNVDAIFLFTDGVSMLKAEINTTSEDYKALQDEVLQIIANEKSQADSPPINVIGLGDYFSTRLSGPGQVHMPFGVFLMEVAQRSGGTFLGR